MPLRIGEHSGAYLSTFYRERVRRTGNLVECGNPAGAGPRTSQGSRRIRAYMPGAYDTDSKESASAEMIPILSGIGLEA
jgi:hypothetical protein